MIIHWQDYEHNKSGEYVRIQRLKDGTYETDAGVKYTLAQLNHYFTWIRPCRSNKNQQKFITNINGFKVRIK